MYYAPTAYNSEQIPELPPQTTSLTALDRATSARLPWGNTKDIAPASFVKSNSPESVRKREQYRNENLDTGVEESQLCINHECFRYASFSFRTQFWGYMAGCGKIFFFLFTPITLWTVFDFLNSAHDDWQTVLTDLKPFLWFFIGLPLLCWISGATVLQLFPDWVTKLAAGPKWELNRRTGMVTLYKYKRRFPYWKSEQVGEFSAPFYEFDAYVDVIPDRQGLPFNYLLLIHRYEGVKVDIDLLGGVRNPEECMALWDMWQNFMDISHPLPDIPLWEEYRHLDPTTAEQDRRTGRSPRYWRDMDDKTFEKKISELRKQVGTINTLSRYNLMEHFVEYSY